jgi:cytochrome oxidase Cu insertion factor (SCO1/SenC/PrrC family)
MSGMGGSLNTNNPTITSAFQTAIVHQALLLVLVAAVLALAWNVLRTVQYRATLRPGPRPLPAPRPPQSPEAPGRRVLRIGFGVVWLFDGLLQVQNSMPLGLPSGAFQPAAGGSPGWVQDVVHTAVTTWSNHPVTAAAAAVWIQVGIGIWLLAVPRGPWLRAGALVSAGWGLIVWAFGEAFGGIFAPGLSWLFGAPGAVLFYVVAGALIALPERWWRTPRLGRAVLGGTGLFFVGMAVLQAWPGRGFWQGQPHPHVTAGTITAMAQSMAQTPQPGIFSSWVSSFAAFDAAHGWGVNLFVVAALGCIGVALLVGATGRARIALGGVVGTAVLGLACWVLVQDLGFFGGVGTDPNSMIPQIILVGSGYLAMVRLPRVAPEPDPAPAIVPAPARASWWRRLSTSPSTPASLARGLLGVGAAVVVLVGAAPMALAATDPVADPILYQALDGSSTAQNSPTPPFNLVDQRGKAVSLQSLRGKALAVTFLDPVCTTDCPLIAQEFKQADQILGSQARRAEFIAIVANPLYLSVADTQAFDRAQGMTGLRNWFYLTGTRSELERVWTAYGVQAEVAPAGAMVAHSELAYIIDPRSRTRFILDADPGQGTAAQRSSFAGVLVSKLQQVLDG